MSDSALLTGGPLPLPRKCIPLKWYFLYSAHRSLTPTPVPISLGASPPTLALFFFLSTSLLFTLRRSQPPSSDPFPPPPPFRLALALNHSLAFLRLSLHPYALSPSLYLCVSLFPSLSFPRWWLMAEGSSMEYRSV